MEPPVATVSTDQLRMSPIKTKRSKRIKQVGHEVMSSRLAEKRIEKARVAANYIKLIYHSQHCMGSCSNPMCRKTGHLVSHCMSCDSSSTCPEEGCYQTKTLMNHVHECKMKSKRKLDECCLICTQVESARVDADMESLNAVAGMNADDDHVSVHYVEKAKEAAKYVKLIFHSQRCKGSCGDVMCSRTKKLVSHCIPCQLGSSCTHEGCRQTKTLMNHVQDCKSRNRRGESGGCLICSQLDRIHDIDAMRVHSFRPDDGVFAVPLPPKRFRNRLEVSVKK